MDARFDLGNMVQAVYNTAHGHFLEITTGELKPRQMSRLGSHVDPILALFALPWLVWPSPDDAARAAGGHRGDGRVAGVPPGHARSCVTRGPAACSPAPTCSTPRSASSCSTSSTRSLWPRRSCCGPSCTSRRAVAGGRRRSSSSPPPARRPCRLSSPSWGCTSRCASARGGRWSSRRSPARTSSSAVWVIIPHFNGGQSAFIARYGEYGAGAGQVVKHGAHATRHRRPPT